MITNDRFPKGSKHKIVKDLLKPDAVINWPIEFSSLKWLITRYPEPKFWLSFSLPFKLNSLCWLKKDGLAEVERAYWIFKLDWKAKQSNIMCNHKVGEDYIPTDNRPTLRQILKK